VVKVKLLNREYGTGAVCGAGGRVVEEIYFIGNNY
jgi:hypothetical protein